MPVRAIRVAAVLCAALASTSSARTLHDEAVALRTAFLSNASKLSSVRFDSRVAVQRLDAQGAAAGKPEDRTEGITWDQPGRRMKWTSPRADPSAYAADAAAGTLRLLSRALSATLTELPPDRAEAYTTPSPGWLWHPERVVPTSPVSVREDGAALVLVSARGHPRREVWLNRTTGVLERFTETDATGVLVRDVRCREWRVASGVALPGEIEETIRGKAAGLRRTVRFTIAAVNDAVTAADFLLP